MKLDDVFEVIIIDDNHNGVGIAKIDNIPIFVDKTVTNDIVKVKITEVNKKYLKGEILSFINKEQREKVNCPYYDKCGGCDLLHVTYERENELKKNYISKLFKDFNVKITYFSRFNYRNKITLHVKNNRLGLYEESTNKIIPITKCLLVDNDINDLIAELNSFDLSKISEIIIKKGVNGLLIAALGKIKNDDLSKLINNKKIVSIYQNDLLIYGEKYILEEINNIKYVCNNGSFFQVNNECTKALYDKVKSYVDKDSKVLDLYCGSGTIGIYSSDICKSITGVEINKDSVLCCRENLKLNNIKNYQIIHGDASVIKDNFDIVIVDPPRSGLSKKVINNLLEINSNKIIYISCNPSTLKRDIDLLSNYELKEVSAFNMFSGTKHVETICILKEGNYDREIIEKARNEIVSRSNEFEKETQGTKDEYNLWKEYVQYVYKYALLIAKNKNVDMDVIELSALLHDIAMTDSKLERSKHNEYGSEIAGELLKKIGLSDDKIEFVKKCILNHSSKRKEYRTTEEEKILVNADAMAHFDCIESLYSLASNVMGLNEEDSVQFVKDKLTKDYLEIDDEIKSIISDKYEKIMESNTLTDMLN